MYQWCYKIEYLFGIQNSKFTLNEPRFFTEHDIRTFLPAGTVTFSMISVNSGSSETAIHVKKRIKKEFNKGPFETINKYCILKQ